MFKDRLCVLGTGNLRQEILIDAHTTSHSIHPGSTKMYKDIQRHFRWLGMKKVVARFVAECLTYQQVKTEHKKLAGLLKPLPILEWK